MRGLSRFTGLWNFCPCRFRASRVELDLFTNSFFFGACLKQDEKLKRVVEQHGEVWETVASFFEDRSDVQCQHRWTKVVNPQLVKGPWTKEVSTSFRLALLSQHLYYPIASFV